MQYKWGVYEFFAMRGEVGGCKVGLHNGQRYYGSSNLKCSVFMATQILVPPRHKLVNPVH